MLDIALLYVSSVTKINWHIKSMNTLKKTKEFGHKMYFVFTVLFLIVQSNSSLFDFFKRSEEKQLLKIVYTKLTIHLLPDRDRSKDCSSTTSAGPAYVLGSTEVMRSQTQQLQHISQGTFHQPVLPKGNMNTHLLSFHNSTWFWRALLISVYALLKDTSTTIAKGCWKQGLL